jgi:hypothetical protein
MSLSVREWMKEAGKLPETKRVKYAKALDTIDKWKPFQKHYGWTGYTMVKFALNNPKAKK